MTKHMISLIYGLSDYEEFNAAYRNICSIIADISHSHFEIDQSALDNAYLHWLGILETTLEARRPLFAQLMGAISGLIFAITRQPIVVYNIQRSAVVDMVALNIRRYPNEITALTIGAFVYSQITQDRTGSDPSCPLEHQQVLRAARKLRENPKQARAFRRLLNLKKPQHQ